MDVVVRGAIKFNHIPTEWEVKEYAGRCARMCYNAGTVDKLLTAGIDKGLIEKDTKVAEQTLESGHHSVYDHVYITLSLERIPKILAMLLNNEHAYTTSEQSGRYTKLEAGGVERDLYEKWQRILQAELQTLEIETETETFRLADALAENEDSPEKRIEKLALENARYFISVFTPATTMFYTCSIRQLNYLYHWMAQFGKMEVFTDFEKRLQKVAQDFCLTLLECNEDLIIPGLIDNKRRGLSLLTEWRQQRLLQPVLRNGLSHKDLACLAGEEPDEWGARGYSTHYWGSFAQLAQAHRHRTLHYEMAIPHPELASFYVPPIVSEDWVEEWLNDMELVRDDYPQGMIVRIGESGRLEDLVQKCQERICGEAQLEICAQTLATANKYYSEVMWGGGRWNNPFVAAVLHPYTHGGGCRRMKLSEHKCTKPCCWVRHGVELKDRVV